MTLSSSQDSATPKRLDPVKILHDVSRINRAYNLMYALGSPVDTFELSLDEAESLIQTAHEVAMGQITTELHREISVKVSPHMLKYVSIGYMERAR